MNKPVVIFVAMLAVFAGIKGYAQTEPRFVPAAPAKSLTTVPVKPMPLHFMVLPPAEYDHDYDGDLTIRMVESLAELHAYCKLDAPQMLACSVRNARSCLIVMVDDVIMRKRGWNTGLILRHERGHCNGWPGDHPGERPLITSTHWVPESERVRLSPQEMVIKGDRR